MPTVSEYIFDFLAKKGLKTVFMVSGSSAMWLTDALKRNESLEAICTHHEQAAAMAADVYGRVHQIPGAALVTIGPGATNAITGVAGAYVDSSPMFVISGQASSKLLRYEVETGIRQCGTQSLSLQEMVSPITKYFAVVWEPDSIVGHMEKAYQAAMSGRKGPVWIDVPVDIQNKQIQVPEPANVKNSLCSSGRDNQMEQMKEVREQLAKAKRPVLLAGFGVRSGEAVDELRAFARKHQIPVALSRGGIDVFPSESPLFLGRPGGYGDRTSHFAIQQADFLLILGSRLSVSTTGYYPDQFGGKAFKVMVDIDEKELARENVPIQLKLQMDIKKFLQEINKDEYESGDTAAWLQECSEWKAKYPNVLPEYEKEKPLNTYYFTQELAKAAAKDAIVVVDTGSVCNIVSQSWSLKEKQRYIISGGLSCMGFWAGAIGAASMGFPVIAIAGDGSTQMNIQEFATLQYNHLPIKLFVYNNNGYMLIRHNQHNYMHDRFLGVGPDSGLQTPDFCAVAKAYGLPAVRITAEDDIQAKIQDVLHRDGPVVCEVMAQEFMPIVPRIASKVMPDGSLKAADFDDLYPFLDKE